MQNSTKRPGHSYCSNCHQTFPSSWFQTRGATRKEGHDFCSQKCKDNYGPEGRTIADMFFGGPAMTIGRR